jgi:hypothetical protein
MAAYGLLIGLQLWLVLFAWLVCPFGLVSGMLLNFLFLAFWWVVSRPEPRRQSNLLAVLTMTCSKHTLGQENVIVVLAMGHNSMQWLNTRPATHRAVVPLSCAIEAATASAGNLSRG